MLTFKKNYFLLAFIIFWIEVFIALYIHDTFIRPYLGDVLVVILIYCFIKSFFDWPVFNVALFVLIFSFAIEILQYFNGIEMLGLAHSSLARTVIGTSFSLWDLLTYVLGISIVLIFEKFLLKKS